MVSSKDSGYVCHLEPRHGCCLGAEQCQPGRVGALLSLTSSMCVAEFGFLLGGPILAQRGGLGTEKAWPRVEGEVDTSTPRGLWRPNMPSRKWLEIGQVCWPPPRVRQQTQATVPFPGCGGHSPACLSRAACRNGGAASVMSSGICGRPAAPPSCLCGQSRKGRVVLMPSGPLLPLPSGEEPPGTSLGKHSRAPRASAWANTSAPRGLQPLCCSSSKVGRRARESPL